MPAPEPLGPEVSIVIPTRDRLRRLRRTVAGALAQDDVDVEVVVVDDGSTDGTAGWLEALSSERVVAVRLDPSQGLPRARNAGIGAARGEWTAFLDDDDLWSPHKLRRQLAELRRAGASWGYCAALMVDDDLRPLSLGPAPEPDNLFRELLVRQVISAGSSNVIVRTAAVRSAGGFDVTLPNLADWDLWIRLAAAGPAASCPDPLVACVHHADNMHARQDVGAYLGELARFVALHDEERRAQGMVFDEREFSAWLARGLIRAGRPAAAARLYVRDGVRHRDPITALRALRAPLGGRPLRRRTRRGRPGRPAWLEAYQAL